MRLLAILSANRQRKLTSRYFFEDYFYENENDDLESKLKAWRIKFFENVREIEKTVKFSTIAPELPATVTPIYIGKVVEKARITEKKWYDLPENLYDDDHLCELEKSYCLIS